MALATVFLYQGIVPKLVFRHPDELALMGAAGVPATMTTPAVMALGVVEVTVALALLGAYCRSWPVWMCLIAMPIATIVVGLSSPSTFGAAFNPFSLNASVAALAAIDRLVMPTVPSATRCRRRPPPAHS